MVLALKEFMTRSIPYLHPSAELPQGWLIKTNTQGDLSGQDALRGFALPGLVPTCANAEPVRIPPQ